jgi:nucleoside-diphosphate-sugar epimerase
VDWTKKRTLVTGGASFIGSHLVEALLRRGAWVRVVDYLSSGSLQNLDGPLADQAIEFAHGDLLDPDTAARAVDGIETVFHIAADHGGRGYIDFHQVNCATNLILDGNLFRAAAQAQVERVIFASSGCVYPNNLQADPEELVYLTEDLVGPPYDCDNLYGWSKLMGEMTLRAYCEEGRLKGASCRYFTAYGPRCQESHAVMAMIARAFARQDPFEIWGTGQQVRNWTHVSDIVEGTIRASERIDDGSAVNIGTTERTKVVDCARLVLEYMDFDPELRFDHSKPTGPYNRVADDRRCREILGWSPTIPLSEGLISAIDWYKVTHEPAAVLKSLEVALTERIQNPLTR